MAARRLALLIANSEYQNAELRKLNAPLSDIQRLASLLSRPEIGGYETQLVHNGTKNAVERTIDRVLRDAAREDTALIFFAGHGVKDDDGELYFAVADTESEYLGSTAISAVWLRSQMQKSRVACQIVLLDCCFGGAFARGSIGRGNQVESGRALEVPDLKQTGRGQAVITAADATQFAFEDGSLEGQAAASHFTRVLFEALETGDADTDNDGYITVDELFSYIEKQLRVQGSPQRPTRWLFNAKEGELLFALNLRAAQRRCSQEKLRVLAEEYVRLRKEMESGRERTQMMARLMWSMRRELGKTASTEAEVKQWLTGSDGDRLVGLAAVQVNPQGTFGTEVFSMIAKRHTRFEQYQALNSAYDMLSSLDLARLQQLEMSIAEAIGTSITDEDSSRWDLARRLLEDVRKRAKIFE